MRDKDITGIKELEKIYEQKKFMSNKINPRNKKEIDFMFDGHIEKPLSKMTPKEKIRLSLAANDV